MYCFIYQSILSGKFANFLFNYFNNGEDFLAYTKNLFSDVGLKKKIKADLHMKEKKC